jgi:hypothetical protein
VHRGQCELAVLANLADGDRRWVPGSDTWVPVAPRRFRQAAERASRGSPTAGEHQGRQQHRLASSNGQRQIAHLAHQNLLGSH